jgi:CheY-like chemotaxis protein
MEFKPKILVVEDEVPLLKLLADALEEMGAEPLLVPSSERAAELIEEERFDGVFLDWRMPEIDGLELARRIRRSKSNARVPIIMLTGATEPGALKQSFAAGVNYFFQKPLSLDKLRHLLNASRGHMLAERRRHQRVSITLPLFCQWEKAARTGTILNLSASAALVALMEPPPVGTRLTAEFEVPDHKKQLSIPASVARHVPGPPESGVPRIVIEFLHHDSVERQLLEEFVEKCLV